MRRNLIFLAIFLLCSGIANCGSMDVSSARSGVFFPTSPIYTPAEGLEDVDAAIEDLAGRSISGSVLEKIAVLKSDVLATLQAIASAGVEVASSTPTNTIASKINSIPEPEGNAEQEHVLSGQTFSNADQIGITGTMPNIGDITITPATDSQSIPAGFHSGAGAVSGDVDLIPENIKKLVTIFGVEGTLDSTATASELIPVLKTGQTTVYRAGDDGTYQAGVEYTQRFVDNNDGTFTDAKTGLMWIKDVNGVLGYSVEKTWNVAITGVNDLTYATYSDWRVPNIHEAITLLDYGDASGIWPELDPLITVGTSYLYWTSTTLPTGATGAAYYVKLNTPVSNPGYGTKTTAMGFALAVRGP